MEQPGKLHSWNDAKGFGFIQPDNGGPQLFVHISAVRGASRPLPGSKVFFVAGTDASGRPRAEHMRSAALELDRPNIRRKPQPTRASQPPPRQRNPASPASIRGLAYKLPLLAALMALPLAGATQLFMSGIPWFLPAYLLASLTILILFWSDKRRALQGNWRIPENTLHGFELLGGWPGTLLAQQLFRHKTRKGSYLFTLWLVIALHQLFWLDRLIMNGRFVWHWLTPWLG